MASRSVHAPHPRLGESEQDVMNVLYDSSLFRVHKVEKVAGILSKLGLTGRMKLHDRKELERQQRSSDEQEE
ncbi:hypothetical protein [Azospirillum argentinense]